MLYRFTPLLSNSPIMDIISINVRLNRSCTWFEAIIKPIYGVSVVGNTLRITEKMSGESDAPDSRRFNPVDDDNAADFAAFCNSGSYLIGRDSVNPRLKGSVPCLYLQGKYPQDAVLSRAGAESFPRLCGRTQGDRQSRSCADRFDRSCR